MCEETLKEKRFPSTGALAQKFRREVPASARKGKNAQEKEAFRLNWCAAVFQNIKECRRKIDEVEDEDIAAGNYEPFDVIVEKDRVRNIAHHVLTSPNGQTKQTRL